MSPSSALRAALCALLLLLAVGPGRARASVDPTGLAQQESDGHAVTDRHAPLVPWRQPALIKGVLETPNRHFRIAYTARSEAAARALVERIESAREQFRQTLGRDWPGVTEVRLGMGREEYEALALGEKPPPWAVALAYPGQNLVLLEATSLTRPDGFTTLLHELSHVALGQLGGNAWPHWFQEGLAMYLSGERFALNQYSTLFRAVRQERIFQFEDLARHWPEHPLDVEIAYAQSLSFVSYLAERHGPEKFGAMLDWVGRGDPFETAFAKAFSTSLGVEEKGWRDGLALRYGWLPVATSSALALIIAAVLCVVAFVVRRVRKARRLAEMSAEESAQDAAERLLATRIGNPEASFPPELPPEFHGEDGEDPLEDTPGEQPPPPKPTIH